MHGVGLNGLRAPFLERERERLKESTLLANFLFLFFEKYLLTIKVPL